MYSRAVWFRTTFLFLVLLLPGKPSHAQSRPRCQPDKAQARQLVQQGRQLLGERQYRGAVNAFQQAYCFFRSPKIAFNLALAYALVGDNVPAYRYLRLYQKSLSRGVSEPLPAPLMALRQTLGVLHVQALRPGDTIWVDGRWAGTGRAEAVVRPGTRAVELRRGAHLVMRKMFEVQAGQELFWTPTLIAPGPRRVPPRTGGTGPATEQAQPRHRRLHWAYFTASAAVTLASGIALIGTGVGTLQLRHKINHHGAIDLEDKFYDYKLSTNVLVGVTAAAAAASTLLAIFTQWKRTNQKRPSTGQSPAIWWDGRSITLMW